MGNCQQKSFICHCHKDNISCHCDSIQSSQGVQSLLSQKLEKDDQKSETNYNKHKQERENRFSSMIKEDNRDGPAKQDDFLNTSQYNITSEPDLNLSQKLGNINKVTKDMQKYFEMETIHDIDILVNQDVIISSPIDDSKLVKASRQLSPPTIVISESPQNESSYNQSRDSSANISIQLKQFSELKSLTIQQGTTQYQTADQLSSFGHDSSNPQIFNNQNKLQSQWGVPLQYKSEVRESQGQQSKTYKENDKVIQNKEQKPETQHLVRCKTINNQKQMESLNQVKGVLKKKDVKVPNSKKSLLSKGKQVKFNLPNSHYLREKISQQRFF